MLVTKTNIQVNLTELQEDYIQNIDSWPKHKNRISLNNHDGVDEYVKNNGQRLIYTEFDYMNSIFEGTVWEDTLNLIPGKIGRARIMIMDHEKLLTKHRDIEARWHIALFTDPSSIVYDFESGVGVHIPADGYIYKLDGRRLHTAFNSSNNFQRVHLVVCENV